MSANPTADPAAASPDTGDALYFSVQGMSCASCASRVEKTLREAPGVRTATVNFATAAARVVVDPGRTDARALARAVASAGYGLEPRTRSAPSPVESYEEEARGRPLAVVAAVSPVVVAAAVVVVAGDSGSEPFSDLNSRRQSLSYRKGL